MDEEEVLEGELVEGEVEEQLSEQAQQLASAGLISDEIDIFDIAATDGPAYELDDLTIEQIAELTNRLDSRN